MSKLDVETALAEQLLSYVSDGDYADASAVLRDGLKWFRSPVDPWSRDHSLGEARADYRSQESEPLRPDERDQGSGAGSIQRVAIELDEDVIRRIRALLNEAEGRGDFSDESAVVSTALFLLEERRKLIYVRGLIAEADAQFDRGEYTPWNPETMDQLRARARQMAREGISPKPDVVQ